MAESEELKSLLMKMKEESEKDRGIWSHHFMTNRWATMKTVTDYFWGSKITADGDCTHEIKRHLLLERKVMTDLDSILKNRDITLTLKVHIGFSGSHVLM